MRQTAIKIAVIAILLVSVFPSGLVGRTIAGDNVGPPPVNQVRNGGFEDLDEHGLPANWGFALFNGEYEATVVTSVYSEGKRSLRIQASQEVRVNVNQVVPVLGGEMYTLSQNIMLGNVSGSNGVTIRVQYYDANQVNLGSQYYGMWKGTSDWFHTEFALRAPDDAATLRLEYFLREAYGTMWLDDVQLVRGEPTGGLLQNGGFESDNGDGDPLNWTFANFTGSYDAVLDKEVYIEGGQSLKIHAEQPARVSVYQDIQVNGGQYVKLEHFIKTESIEGGNGATIRVQFYDASNTNLGSVGLEGWKGSRDWSSFTRYILPPEGTVRMRLELFLWNATGTVWFDRVSVDLSNYPPPTITQAVYRTDGQAYILWEPNPDMTDTEHVGVTLSVYSHSFPLTDANLSSATLQQTLIPIMTEHAIFSVDPILHPYVGIVAHDPLHGDSSVISQELEPYQVPVPEWFESVQGFDGNIVSAWKSFEPDEFFLQGATVTLYTYDQPLTKHNLSQARLLGTNIPVDYGNAQNAPVGETVSDTFIGLIVTDIDHVTSEVVTGNIKKVSQILPYVDEYETVSRSHPFLFYTQDTLDQAIANIDSYLWARNAFDHMKKRIDLLVDAPSIVLPVLGTGSRSASGPILQFMSDTRDAALLYQLTDDQRYAAYVKDVLVALSTDYVSMPYVDSTQARWDFELLKEVRHMMLLMCAYDLIMPSGLLSEQEQKLIETELFRTNYINSRYYIESRSNMRYSNWVTWMNFSIGTTGLLLNRPDWVDFAVNHPVTGIRNHLLNNINEDGFFVENAVSYLKTTASAAIGFAEVLRNSNLDLYHVPIDGIRERDGLPIENKYPIQEMLASLDYYRFSNNAVPPVGDSNVTYYDPFIESLLGGSELAYIRYNKDANMGRVLGHIYGQERLSRLLGADFIFAVPLDSLVEQPFTIGSNQFANLGYNWLGSTVFEDTGAVFLRSTGGRLASNLNVYWDPYGAASGHYHSDKLSFNLHMLGQSIVEEAGLFSYDQNGPQIPWARTTLAHNTIVVDETSQAPQALRPWGMWADDSERFTGGEKKALSLGSVFRVIRAYNDQAYGGVLPIYESTFSREKIEDRPFETALDRTLIMIDDYVVDLFHASSPYDHQYDYSLNFPTQQSSGTVTGQVLMQPVSGTLGTKNGYDQVTNVSRGSTDHDWSYTLTQGEAIVDIRMLAEPGTEVIRGSTIGDNSILVARRDDRQETFYIALFEAYENASKILDFSSVSVTGPAKGVSIEMLDGTVDSILVGQGQGAKSVGNTTLSSDGNVAFKRTDSSGATVVLGFTEGMYVDGGDASLESNAPVSSLQLTQLDSGIRRLDYMGNAGIEITIAPVSMNEHVYLLDEQGMVVKQLTDVRDNGQLTFVTEGSRQAYCICEESALSHLPPAVEVQIESVKYPYADIPKGVLARLLDGNEIDGRITVEAELLAGQSGGSVVLTEKPGAQPVDAINSFSHWDNLGHTIEWEVHIDEPGEYMVLFRYAAALDRAFRTFRIDDSAEYNIYFPKTGGWNEWENKVIHYPDGNPMVFTLTQGHHTIEMINSSLADGIGTNLDYIQLIRMVNH